MNCERCNNEMKWVGDLLIGSMCCPHCSCLECPDDDEGYGSDIHERTGMWKSNGDWMAECCVCGHEFIADYTPEKLKGDSDPQHYCGGSYRCCP